MDRSLVGKSLLTFVLIGGSLVSYLADWNVTHVFNPLWHPHARYQIAVNLFFFAAVASVATWLLWRPSKEPRVVFNAARLFSLVFRTPFFDVPLFVPGASYWEAPGEEPRIAGMIGYPNLVVFAVFVASAAARWWLGRSASPDRGRP